MDDNRQQPWFLFLLLTFLGIGTPMLSRSSSAPSPGAQVEQVPAPASISSEKPEDSCTRVDAPDARRLIVTVPDPLDSTVDYSFDRALDAIRRAAIAAGYEPDRFCLPWIHDRRAAVAQDKVGQKDHFGQTHLITPGRMLFRGDHGWLLVYLVGETSTWGVQPDAMDKALELAAGTSNEILVAGPTFSGSARSLRSAIERLARKGPPWSTKSVHVVTGSATGRDVKSILSAFSPWTDELAGLGVTVKFESMVPSDEVLLDRFFRYLTDETHTLGRSKQDRINGTEACLVFDVAMLRETGTAYGGEGPGSNEKCSEGEPIANNVCRLGEESGKRPCAHYMPVLEVQYAPHIASVSRAYERQRRQAGSDKQKEEQGPPSRALQMSLGQEEERTEILPALSTKTPYSEDLVLTQALSAMCRQEMRWVGILGTDTIDRLFLAQKVKERCPNVRLFFLESDLFYTHPEHSRELDGSVVVSSYPLLPQNRAWSAPFDSRTIAPFASQSDQGLFNAVLELLGKRAKQRERFMPFQDGAEDQAVWLSVVGNGGLWPLAVRSASWGNPAITGPLNAGRDAHWVFDSPGQWRFSLTIFSLFVTLLSVGYWAAQIVPAGSLPWGVGWAAVFAQRLERRGRWQRLLFRVIALWPATLIYLLALDCTLIEELVNAGNLWGAVDRTIAGNVWEAVFENKDGWKKLNGGLMIIIALSLLLASIDVLAITALPSLAQRPLSWGPLKVQFGLRIRLLLAELVVLAAGIALLGSAHRGIDPLQGNAGDPIAAVTRAILFRERAGNLSTGLSILVPALALALALFLVGYFNLLRLGCLPEGPETILFPAGKAEDFEVAGGKALVNQVRKSIRSFAGGWPLAVLALGAIVLAWLPFWDRIGTLEGRAWDGAFWIASGGVLFLALSSLFGFLNGWRRLRALLQRVACMPLAAAWGRLPARYTMQLGEMLLARPPNPAELGLSVRQFRLLVKALPTDSFSTTSIREHLEALEVEKSAVEELECSEGPQDDATLGVTYCKLCEAASLVAKELREGWLEAPPAPRAAPGEKEGKAEVPSAHGQPAWIAPGEDLVVTLLAAEIYHVLARLRARLTLSLGALLALLMMVSAYPFERQRSLLWVMEIGVIVAVAGAVLTFVQMSRNEVLSWIQHTQPGSVNFNRTFVMKIVLFAVLPLFSVAAAGIPALGQALFGWVLPLLRVMQ